MSSSAAPAGSDEAVDGAFPGVSFLALCESVAEFGYVALRDLVEFLTERRPNETDAAANNVLIIETSQRERHRLLRLLTLCRWLHHNFATMRTAQRCVVTAEWLANRYERAGADVLWSLYQQTRSEPLFASALDIHAAATVSTTSSYDRLPLVLHRLRTGNVQALAAPAIQVLGCRTYLLLRTASATMHVRLRFHRDFERNNRQALVRISDQSMPGWEALVGLRPQRMTVALPTWSANAPQSTDWDWFIWKLTLDQGTAYAALAARILEERYQLLCRKQQLSDMLSKTRYFIGCLVSCISVELYEPLRIASLAKSVEVLSNTNSRQKASPLGGTATSSTSATIRVQRLDASPGRFRILYWPSAVKPPNADAFVMAENRWWYGITLQCTHLTVPPTPEWLWDPSLRLQVPLYGYVRVEHQPPLPVHKCIPHEVCSEGDGVALVAAARRARSTALLQALVSERSIFGVVHHLHPTVVRLVPRGDSGIALRLQVHEPDGLVALSIDGGSVLEQIRNLRSFMEPALPAWLRPETWPVWLPIPEQRRRVHSRLEALYHAALHDQVWVVAQLHKQVPFLVYLLPEATRSQLALKLTSGSYFVPVHRVLAALLEHDTADTVRAQSIRIMAYVVDTLRRLEFLTTTLLEQGVLANTVAIDSTTWSGALALVRGHVDRLSVPVSLKSLDVLEIQASWLHLEVASLKRSPWSLEVDIAPDLFDCCLDTSAVDGEYLDVRMIVTESPVSSPGAGSSAEVPAQAQRSATVADPERRRHLVLQYPQATAAYVQRSRWDLTRAAKMAMLLRDSSLQRMPIRRTGSFSRLERLCPARFLVRLGTEVQLVITYRCDTQPHGYMVAFRHSRSAPEFAIRIVEQVLNAQPCYTVLYGLLERTLPLALAAAAAFHGLAARYRFLSALRLRVAFVAGNASSRSASTAHYVLELDAKEGNGLVRITDVGAQAARSSGAAPVAPLPHWRHVSDTWTQRTGTSSDDSSFRVPLGELEQVLRMLLPTSTLV